MLRTMIAAFTVTTLAACGSASLVRKDASGGGILLQGQHMAAMAEARMLMAEYCRGRSDSLELDDRLEFRCRDASAAEFAAALAPARQLQPQPPPVVPSAPLEASR